MHVVFTAPFQDQYRKLSADVKRKFEKQLLFLLKDMRHPSLRAKKYDEGRDVWQARVDGHYRFYFQICNDAYWMLGIMRHRD